MNCDPQKWSDLDGFCTDFCSARRLLTRSEEKESPSRLRGPGLRLVRRAVITSSRSVLCHCRRVYFTTVFSAVQVVFGAKNEVGFWLHDRDIRSLVRNLAHNAGICDFA